VTAFYNEIDPYAAAWLENLIAAGYIAPGVVDRRPIQEIEAWELAEFTQCHFFAGIGIWSHALRRAGWPDDRPIWTGSCPCQPFSAAGQRKGISDERHLWPYWHQLIDQCRPAIVLGEQVASKDGLGWLDLVSTDLEASGYAFGASDLCAAGFGGAHIRQRLYFCAAQGLDDTAGARRFGAIGGTESDPRDQARLRVPGAGGGVGGVGNTFGIRRQFESDGIRSNAKRMGTSGQQPFKSGETGSSEFDRLADSDDTRPQGRGRVSECASERAAGQGGVAGRPHAPMLGRNPADWLLCRDGKWRPVEPGTFPLADAAPARVGRLRAYGNALDAETAAQFCEVVREIADDLRPLMREYDL
jgi:DNA (cytosine-5)-methyltransferase 1